MMDVMYNSVAMRGWRRCTCPVFQHGAPEDNRPLIINSLPFILNNKIRYNVNRSQWYPKYLGNVINHYYYISFLCITI